MLDEIAKLKNWTWRADLNEEQTDIITPFLSDIDRVEEQCARCSEMKPEHAASYAIQLVEAYRGIIFALDKETGKDWRNW